jgi:hypothetical protein
LPGDVEVRYFTSPGQFAEKLRKHFLNPDEPWGRVLGVEFLRRLGRKLKAGDVSGLEEAYGQVVAALDEGVRFAEGCPLYLVVDERVAPPCGGSFPRRVHYLLADRGFRVIVHGHHVRTAFFSSKTPSDSNYTLFREAWRALKARGLAPGHTDEETGSRATHDRVEWHSEVTWANCPAPPGRGPAEGKLPPEVRAWLDELPSGRGKR